MAFTIRSRLAGSTVEHPQSELQVPSLEALVAGIGGSNGVISGLTVTGTGSSMALTIAAGVVRTGGIRKVVSGATKTPAAADTTNPRIDLLVVDSSGVIQLRAGTAAATPAEPTLTAGDVLLCHVYIPANASSLSTTASLTDRRVIVREDSAIYASAYLALQADTATGHTTALNAMIADLVASSAIAVAVCDWYGQKDINDELKLLDTASNPGSGQKTENKTIKGLNWFATEIRQTDSTKAIFVFSGNSGASTTGGTGVSGAYSFANCEITDFKLTYQTQPTLTQNRAYGIAFENAQVFSRNTFYFINLDRLWIVSAFIGIGIRPIETMWGPSMSVATNQLVIPTRTSKYLGGFTHKWKVTAGGGGTTGATEPTWNQGITTLAAAVTTTGQTAWTIQSNANSLFSAGTPFYVQVGSEIVQVTAYTPSTGAMTVVRAQLGTSASTYSNGATVTAVVRDNATSIVYTDQGTGDNVAQYLTLWGSTIGKTFVRIHDVTSQAILWASNGAGQPENVIGNIYLQNAGVTPTTPSIEPAFELENVEVTVQSLGIEDWNNQLIRLNGDEQLVINLLHIERCKFTVANSSFIKADNNVILIGGWRCYDVDGGGVVGNIVEFKGGVASGLCLVDALITNTWNNNGSLVYMKGTLDSWSISQHKAGGGTPFLLTTSTGAADSMDAYNGSSVGGINRVSTAVGIPVTREQVRVTLSANSTTATINTGLYDGQVLKIISTSAFSITFAAAATSHVQNGAAASNVIAANTSTTANNGATFLWVASISLWVRVA